MLRDSSIYLIINMQTESFIPGKDASLESTIATIQQKLAARGFHLDESSWLNPVESIWSVHVRDRECNMLFANGKGATQLAARASALGEFFERLGTHYFWTHFYLGHTRANNPLCTIPKNVGSLCHKTVAGQKKCSILSCMLSITLIVRYQIMCWWI
jgi:YcaO-like protein with predicted kinase domain